MVDGELVEDFSDEELSDSDAFSETENDNQKEDNFVEVRPEDCTVEMWTSVITLRDARLDNEDDLEQIQKFIEVNSKHNIITKDSKERTRELFQEGKGD